MLFRTFPKLRDSLPDGAPEGPYVALEKIHGAQLVIGTDVHGHTWFGKRKAWLASDDPFFGWQLVRRDLERASSRFRALLLSEGLADQAADVIVYGELFGGGYPHHATSGLAAFTPVQTGIWYAPDLRFAAFAALATSREGGGSFLGFSDVARLAGAAGLLIPPVLGHGSRAELLSCPLRFPTQVPALLGLPAVDGNMAEGFVLQLDRSTPFGSFVACKQKIPEMREAEFDGSVAFCPGRKLPVTEILALVPRMVNRPRLESAGSKVGFHDESMLLDEVELDVCLDLEAALPSSMASLTDEEASSLCASIRRAAKSAADDLMRL